MKKLLFPFLFLLSCTTAKQSTTSPTVNNLYSQAQEWPVKVNDGWLTAKTISFGLYSTSSRKNGVAETMGSFIKDPKTPFNFYVNGNDEHILVQTMNTTRIAFSNRDLPAVLKDLDGSAALSYTLINGTKNEPLKRWEMILKSPGYLELNNNKPTGILRCADTDIRITAHNRYGKVNSYEKVCYEFQYRGQPVAAVIAGDKPRVWVSKDAPAETIKTLAAAIGALLLR
ncbi:hypothetical protein SAMN04488128_1021152 [Chitinophaga eiseniae]|uniref:Uncharacterized protein n=1 Tax=Chitinophaga eiseniae TaxID=634771 RepID=A0A1T4RHP5_9BACT|nr:hypothetical protein [Chitinophaga eiseniae]SKA15427.1 hypothetical protein SAMN04488128_1021152 [Chitinophaga eiseniae]